MIDRAREYEYLGLRTRWLDNSDSEKTYDYVSKYISSSNYGLEVETVSNIMRLEIDSYSVAKEWLRSNLEDAGTVKIVYGRRDICVIDTSEFLKNCFNIFTPGRDDAVVLHDLSKKIMFYCHEQEIEIGTRSV